MPYHFFWSKIRIILHTDLKAVNLSKFMGFRKGIILFVTLKHHYDKFLKHLFDKKRSLICILVTLPYQYGQFCVVSFEFSAPHLTWYSALHL